MDDKLEIGKIYFSDVLKIGSTKLVGEICAHLEIISDPEELKQTIKNTIYQNFRDLKGQLEAFNDGVKFITKVPKTTIK